jgi:hypothetical protein
MPSYPNLETHKEAKDIHEVMAFLRCCRRSVTTWLADGLFGQSVYKVGNKLMFPPEAIEHFLIQSNPIRKAKAEAKKSTVVVAFKEQKARKVTR